jgi:hypothetical protein
VTIRSPSGPIELNVSWRPADQRPLDQPKLHPPQSGPAPQNPPFPGARVPNAVLVSWIPPPPQPPVARNLSPPISGPTPQNPPFRGSPQSRVLPQLNAWLPPAPMPITPILLKPPISGPLIALGIPAALQNLFNAIIAGTNTTACDFDLYTITLFNGQVLRFTTADFDINSGGNLFSSTGLRVDQKTSKVQAHWKVGLDVDTWVVVFMARATDPVTGAAFPDVIGSIPWVQAAHSGYLDAADFQVDRAWFSSVPTWPMTPGGAIPTGTRTIFAGVVASIDASGVTVVVTAQDYRSLLSVSMPLHFWQGQCRHMLFDPGCNGDGTMTRGRFAVAGVAGAGSTQSIIVAPGLAAPGGSGTYALGTLVMTSGQNATFSRTVASWDGTNLQLVIPFPFTVVAGDAFTVAPGCDLQRSTCSLFGNLNNFGGQPFIPVPETIA